ncbi:MAG: hypothetical protein MSD82_02385, partial [Prevotella sp.]|nr:hypothetical protein [Prevotella sp.]
GGEMMMVMSGCGRGFGGMQGAGLVPVRIGECMSGKDDERMRGGGSTAPEWAEMMGAKGMVLMRGPWTYYMPGAEHSFGPSI